MAVSASNARCSLRASKELSWAEINCCIAFGRRLG